MVYVENCILDIDYHPLFCDVSTRFYCRRNDMNAAIYARVSTKKEEQNPETQLIPCRRFCKEQGWKIIEEYIDYMSGRNMKRPQLQKLFKDAMYHRFDYVVVWKMDRFSRGGIRETYNAIDKLKKHNINVYSVTEPFLNTDTPSAELILAVLSWAANQESKNISERVKAGIERWKKEHPGKRWRGKNWDIEKAIKLRRQGMGWRTIEKELRKDGYSITWAGIRKELLKHGFEKGVNLPSKKEIEENEIKNRGC